MSRDNTSSATVYQYAGSEVISAIACLLAVLSGAMNDFGYVLVASYFYLAFGFARIGRNLSS